MVPDDGERFRVQVSERSHGSVLPLFLVVVSVFVWFERLVFFLYDLQIKPLVQFCARQLGDDGWGDGSPFRVLYNFVIYFTTGIEVQLQLFSRHQCLTI